MNKKVSFSAIDIGSNAIKMLIKSVEHNDETQQELLVQELLLRVPIRLGEDAFTKGEISENKIHQMLLLMKSYRNLMDMYNVVAYRACATSAMRDAINAEDIVRRIKEEAQIDIEIIDGKEEAQIIYDTHSERLLGGDNNTCLYVDVGGGSIQVSLINEGNLVFSHSFNIGTVRMMSGKVQPSEWNAFKKKLSELYALYPELNIIGSGGNINKLYKLSGVKKQKNIMLVKTLMQLYDELAPLTVEERIAEYKLRKDRAEVIVYALEIFLEVAEITQVESIIVPTISIGDGIIENLYKEYKNS